MKKQIALLAVSAFLLSGCSLLTKILPTKKSSSSETTSSSQTVKSSESSSSGKSSNSGSQTEDGVPSLSPMKLYYDQNGSIYSISGTAATFKSKPDIRYIEFKEFYESFMLPFYGFSSSPLSTPTRNGDVISYPSVYGYNFTINIDVAKDTFTTNNALISLQFTNAAENGSSLIVNGLDTTHVKVDNTNSRYYETREAVTFELGNYNIDILEYNNRAYLPLNTLMNMYYSTNLIPIVYNGSDLYVATNFSTDDFNGENASSGTLEYQFFNSSPWKKGTRSQSLAEFNYNNLCFALDTFYGLKDFSGISAFDTDFTNKNVKKNLLSTNGNTYEYALASYFGEYVADGHAGYLKNSPFGYLNSSRNYYSSAIAKNEKVAKLYSDFQTLPSERQSAGKRQGLSIYDNTAIITFDAFIKANLPISYVDYYSYEDIANLDSYLLLYKAFKEIESNSNIDNVVIDLTCNGGGMLDAIPWLEAFMTDKPFITNKYLLTGEVSKIVYNVDLNQDGYFGQSSDTYKGKYNFFLMTSSVSFSCGNALPTYVKDGGMATIIGERSGGGACVVSYISTACGNLLRDSSVIQMGTYKDGKFYHNEEGIAVDYEFDRSNFFDDEAISTFVNSL